MITRFPLSARRSDDLDEAGVEELSLVDADDLDVHW